MRITPSSSLFLATLAISSSSSSLAAPTEPGSLDMSALSSSSSIRSRVMMGRHDSFDLKMGEAPPGSLPDTETHMSMQRRQLESLLPILEGLPIVGPIVEGLMDKILGILGLQEKGAAAVESVTDPSKLDALLAVLGEATKKLKDAKSSVTGGDASAGNKRALAMAYGEAMESSSTPSNASLTSQYIMSSTASSSSALPSATSIEAMAVPPTPGPIRNPPVAPPAGNNGTAPSSPALPVNPPNTPTPSSGNMKPPLPVGVPPPSGPIPRDAPPMFPAFRAADASSMAPAATASCASASTGNSSCTPSMTASGSSAAMSGATTASTTANSAQ